MFWSVGLLLGQFAVAFLALDLTFRRMDLSPGALGREVARCGAAYAAAAVMAGLGGGWLQWRLAGPAGLAVAAGNWIPWWILWRFGLRKQLTFLFKDDGGSPMNAQKPDL